MKNEKKQETGKQRGSQTVYFKNPPVIIGAGSVAGKKEGEGPLGAFFDLIEEDPMCGKETWEEAESALLGKAASLAISNAGLTTKDIRFLVGGDLLGQLIATSFGLENLGIPLLGVYGACSTMGESMAVGSMLVEGGFADKVLAITSSHFAGAEKQFRFPLDYGTQRPLAATWTVTGSGAVVISSKPVKKEGKIAEEEEGLAQVRIKGVTIGKITDFGVKDSMNMGACMAPAACDTIRANLSDLGVQPDYYDKIITGDLGLVGKDILIDLLRNQGYDISSNYMDCGIEIFDPDVQDTHAGGSGCGCSAITLAGYILRKMRKRVWNRILFVPTGALLSTVSFNEGQTVPGIAHAVMLENDV